MMDEVSSAIESRPNLRAFVATHGNPERGWGVSQRAYIRGGGRSLTHTRARYLSLSLIVSLSYVRGSDHSDGAPCPGGRVNVTVPHCGRCGEGVPNEVPQIQVVDFLKLSDD